MPGPRKRETPQPAECFDSQSGIALLLVLLIILSLTAFSVSLVLFTQSGSQLTGTMASRSQAYYAALAGLEEARGRPNPFAADALVTLPQQVNQVLYLVNSSSNDPVNPTNSSSSYYDYEYAREFSGGFGGAQVLPSVASDQPGAGTSYVIPYKWVRITLKTEYASKTDVNQDGILNSSTPVNWDGTHQDLATNMPNGLPVYMVTALAVEPNGIRNMEQEEVVGTPPLVPDSGVGTVGSASLTGLSGSTNLTLNGDDYCGSQPNLPGIAAGSAITTSGLMNIQGSPPEQPSFSFPPSQMAPNIIQGLFPQAVPILNADPTHVASVGGSFAGNNVVLGQLPGGSNPGQPAVIYANQSLAISGPTSSGYGILLVNGNLSITDGFLYEGLIVASGTLTITASSAGHIRIHGSLTSFGSLSINSSASPSTSVRIHYDSCAIANAFKSLPLGIRSFKQLSF